MKMNRIILLGFFLGFNLCLTLVSLSQDLPLNVKQGEVLYENTLSSEDEMKDWKLEGPGTIEFKDNWMHMYSPNEEGHHVYWCPEDFPSDFIAEWELQNLEPDAGLCIVFFSALGQNGKDIFDASIKTRDGVFSTYTRSDINCYHISYYANGKDNPAREAAHLRKNAGFHKVQIGEQGIPPESKEIHKMQLVKKGNHITMSVDDREIINWLDDGQEYGPVLGGGKIGLRQMKWAHFRYRNFKVFAID
jgi:hypothetical protein